MKLINAQQNLMAISGGSLGYDIFTKGAAALGGVCGAFVGFLVPFETYKRNPAMGLLMSVVMGPTLTTLGATAGYAGGAVTYTIGNNIGSIVSAPFKVINYIFKPTQ